MNSDVTATRVRISAWPIHETRTHSRYNTHPTVIMTTRIRTLVRYSVSCCDGLDVRVNRCVWWGTWCPESRVRARLRPGAPPGIRHKTTSARGPPWCLNRCWSSIHDPGWTRADGALSVGYQESHTRRMQRTNHPAHVSIELDRTL